MCFSRVLFFFLQIPIKSQRDSLSVRFVLLFFENVRNITHNQLMNLSKCFRCENVGRWNYLAWGASWTALNHQIWTISLLFFLVLHFNRFDCCFLWQNKQTCTLSILARLFRFFLLLCILLISFLFSTDIKFKW